MALSSFSWVFVHLFSSACSSCSIDSFENIVQGLGTEGHELDELDGMEWKVVVGGFTISSLGLIFIYCLLSWSLHAGVDDPVLVFLPVLLVVILLGMLVLVIVPMLVLLSCAACAGSDGGLLLPVNRCTTSRKVCVSVWMNVVIKVSLL